MKPRHRADLPEAPSLPTLAAVLAERDRRSAETAGLLAGGAGVVIRLSLRLPAQLRNTLAARQVLHWGGRCFASACRLQGLQLQNAGQGSGALGEWRLWLSGAPAKLLKKAGLALEEETRLGLVLDLDVETAAGPLGRRELALPPRSCPVCGGAASVCSGRRSHPAAEIAEVFAAHLVLDLPGRAIGADRSSYMTLHREGV